METLCSVSNHLVSVLRCDRALRTNEPGTSFGQHCIRHSEVSLCFAVLVSKLMPSLDRLLSDM